MLLSVWSVKQSSLVALCGLERPTQPPQAQSWAGWLLPVLTMATYGVVMVTCSCYIMGHHREKKQAGVTSWGTPQRMLLTCLLCCPELLLHLAAACWAASGCHDVHRQNTWGDQHVCATRARRRSCCDMMHVRCCVLDPYCFQISYNHSNAKLVQLMQHIQLLQQPGNIAGIEPQQHTSRHSTAQHTAGSKLDSCTLLRQRKAC